MTAIKPPSNVLERLIGSFGSPEFVSLAIEHAPTGVMLIDREHIVAYENISANRILGRDFLEIRGRHLSNIFGGQYRAMLADGDSGSPAPLLKNYVTHGVVIETKEGQKLYAEAVFYSLGGGSDYTICFLTDVTEYKQLQYKLERSNTFFNNLIESSVDGIIAADMKGRIILFNSGAEQMLGYTKEEVGSLHVANLYPEGVARELLRHMRSNDYGGRGRLLRHELICVTKDGRRLPMSLSGGILFDGNEEVATFGIFTDLRVIRKIEQDLEQTNKALVQSEKMAGLGRLAAGVAHEINNPMSGIMLYSNLILEQLGEEHPAAGDLKIIVNEAERCKQIVNDLLEFSHQTGHEQTGVDVNEQVRKSLGILHKQPLFDEIEVVLDLEDGLSRILGNAIRLNQVFINIMVNAAQAMKGSGVLSITTRHRSSRHMVEVRIADTGPGMDKDVLAQIFDPFFTTKANEDGTGLGLSVSYAIVKEHQGTIHVESEPGAGATFTLHFPSAPGETTGAETLPPQKKLG